VSSFGGIDVVVANAAIMAPSAPFYQLSEQDFQSVLDVNLVGVWRTIKAAMPSLLERRGSVVVTASRAAVKGTVSTATALSPELSALAVI
jgi:NAD(P)-dependent dehydrogenase (short-subunit alcohol dehydrogenase family)